MYCKSDSKRVLYAVFAGGAPSDISLFYILDRRGKFLAWLIEVVASGLSSFQVLFQGTSLDFLKVWWSSWMILLRDIKNLCSLFIHEHIFFFIQGMIDKASSLDILGFDMTENFIKLSSPIL